MDRAYKRARDCSRDRWSRLARAKGRPEGRPSDDGLWTAPTNAPGAGADELKGEPRWKAPRGGGFAGAGQGALFGVRSRA